ncbi:MAG: hypothetical protein KJ749_13985, partial [Planctomycetes bacterium]|nr:hypothetical protein [Planctomycetota bacterium]
MASRGSRYCGVAIPCDNASHSRTAQVSVTEAAALGDFTFDLTSTSPSGGNCTATAMISVELAAVLTGDPTSIPATTEWDDMPDYSFSQITVTWDPPDCEGTLEIVELQGTGGYLPGDDGTLTPMG